MPAISVIVPVYQAENYLASCIDSILSQTFSDLEVILVDDGSPDGSGAICDEYAAREPRVSVIHQKNQGQAAARNHALPHAKGSWICFVDSDDLIHPQMLELLYNAATKGNCGISMCQMLEAAELPDTFLGPREEAFEVVTMDEEKLVQLHDADAYPGWVACAKLIRREYIENHPFTPGRVYEDNAVVCHWIYEAKTVAVLSEELYFYRGNPDSTTKKTFTLKRLDYLWALEEIVSFCTVAGYFDLRARFCDRYAETAADYYRRVLYELENADAAKVIKRSVKALLRKYDLCLSKPQFEQLFDAMHPRLIRLYWPLEAAVRTLKEKGVSGLVRKVTQQLRKGDNQ